MEGPRAPNENELPQVFEFLNHQLRPQVSWSIASEYPTALNTTNRGNIRIITENSKILSHAVLKPLIIKTPTIIFKIGAIGSVVTDSQKRGQGLSHQILQSCLNEAQQQECDAVILWTDLYDFYRKFGFELAGFEESFTINKELEVNSRVFKFLKVNQVAAESILRVYNQHTIGSVRNVEDIKRFLSIPNTTLYTAWDAYHGHLCAYAVEGKGADLTGYIHEWGGTVSGLIDLFLWIRKEKKSPITIILGRHSVNLMGVLKNLPGILHNEGYLGMIKIVNYEALFSKIKRASKSIGVNDLIIEKKDSRYRIGVKDDVVEFSDEKDMTRVIFGPIPEIPHLKRETFLTLEKVLPANLWIWGWDSI